MSLRRKAVVAVVLFNTHTVLLPISVGLAGLCLAEMIVFSWESHTS